MSEKAALEKSAQEPEQQKPEIAQRGPYVQEEEKSGKRAWCSCGHSEIQPFCDGNHRGSPFRPLVVSVEGGSQAAWCGCKRTNTPPYCDGSHNQL